MATFSEWLRAKEGKDINAWKQEKSDDQRYTILEEAISEWQNVIDPEKQIILRITIGYMSELGQQYKVMLEAPSIDYSETFFRAYFPPKSQSITLDMYEDESPECPTPDSFYEELWKYMNLDTVKSKIENLTHVIKNVQTPAAA